MENDFREFVQHVEDEDVYLYAPRLILRDVQNPLERYTNSELIQRSRFSRHAIQEILLPLVFPNGAERNRRGLPIPPILMLCAALRFYATGSYQRVCGNLQHVSQSSVCRIINNVSDTIASALPVYIKFPSTPEEYAANRNQFYALAHLPGVTGCIDCTHIQIKSPGGSRAEVYRNRKTWMSFNVQVVAGPQLEILDIVIRWPGSAHDSRIFNNSSVKVRFEENWVPGLLLGDSAYPQLQYLYTPVPRPQTRAEQRYNSAQIMTRNVVERTFGLWKQRFRVINKKLNSNLRNTTRIIAATAVLHNIAVKQRDRFICDPHFEDRDVPVVAASDRRRGNLIRAAFIERHFV